MAGSALRWMSRSFSDSDGESDDAGGACDCNLWLLCCFSAPAMGDGGRVDDMVNDRKALMPRATLQMILIWAAGSSQLRRVVEIYCCICACFQMPS